MLGLFSTKKPLLVLLLAVVLAIASFSSLTIIQPVKAATYPPWNFEDHTYSHRLLTSLTSDEIVAELQKQNQIFQQHNLPPPRHIAYPQGDYDEHVINAVQQYRLSGRLANDGPVPTGYPVSDWFRLSSALLSPYTSFSSIRDLILTTEANKGLLNLFTHDVADPPRTSGGCSAVLLGQILDFLATEQSAGRLSVMTMRQAYTDFDGRKAVVVISFDDGWSTDYTTAWPLFKARGMAGTSFIIGSEVGNDNPDELSWAQVGEMAQGSMPPPPRGWSVIISSQPQAGGFTTPSGTLTGITGSLSVNATSAVGYQFSNWVFDGNTLTGNPVTIPAQPEGSNHTLTATFTPVGLTAQVSMDRSQYTKWSYVNIAVSVTDDVTGLPVRNATVTVNVYNIYGQISWTASDATDPNGQAKFTYKLVFDAQMGTYQVSATVSRSGYQNATGQASFFSIG